MKARGKHINSDNEKYIEGYLLYKLKRFNNKSFIVPEYIRCDNGLFPSWEIDEYTLEYKIGDYWYSMETLERICSNLDIEYLPNKE